MTCRQDTRYNSGRQRAYDALAWGASIQGTWDASLTGKEAVSTARPAHRHREHCGCRATQQRQVGLIFGLGRVVPEGNVVLQPGRVQLHVQCAKASKF